MNAARRRSASRRRAAMSELLAKKVYLGVNQLWDYVGERFGAGRFDIE
jgi:hypothetical protein